MDLPNRKHPRLKDYDYSLPGYYYVTIHIEDDNYLSSVGRGLAPTVKLTQAGILAEQQLLALQTRYPYVRIDKYVIMPTHIHAILCFLENTDDAPRASLTDMICAYKSLTTRLSNQYFATPGRKRFQTSFYESVLRNEVAYQECLRYIEENPLKWALEPEDR